MASPFRFGATDYNVWIVTGLLARLRLPAGRKRTAAIAAWFQGLYRDREAPLLVGAAGAGDADHLEFAGSVPPEVSGALRRVGFREDGPRWVLDSDGVVLELVEPRDTGGSAVVIEVEGIRVRVLPPVETSDSSPSDAVPSPRRCSSE